MKFITKLGVTCVTAAMMVSTMSHASRVVPDDALLDRYIGNSYGNYSNEDYMPNDNNAHYNTNWMTVDKSDQGILTVKIDSNFIGYDSVFKLGDLFLMDASNDNYKVADACNDSSGNTGYRGCNEDSYDSGTNQWEYAFDLGLELNSYSTNNSTNDYINQSGTLRKIGSSNDVTNVGGAYHKSVKTSSQLKTSSSGGRGWQVVDVLSSADAVVDANGNYYGTNDGWSTDVNNKLLTMTFDISGTSLMGADQIALRWAMSCANDIIEVVANLKSNKPGNTAVPEPSTMLLMLLAVVGLFASRKKQASGFKA
ncbi:PEP-CTERM sorting domain-containing protein [Colwellia sp. MSW7]|uniref:PEP-CTERM sorting domain-containing protein n=1 Tax=Colwellia maritima TaxID=2912588 RepID=A0ABS9WWR5_9GAMM|nr:PEP-CTERM sorting domain-containing protein [Colwellia maritima]MCI2282249.1 PEP-CTERM sorting domain-containing protein [Colwellia maritima]